MCLILAMASSGPRVWSFGARLGSAYARTSRRSTSGTRRAAAHLKKVRLGPRLVVRHREVGLERHRGEAPASGRSHVLVEIATRDAVGLPARDGLRLEIA